MRRSVHIIALQVFLLCPATLHRLHFNGLLNSPKTLILFVGGLPAGLFVIGGSTTPAAEPLLPNPFPISGQIIYKCELKPNHFTPHQRQGWPNELLDPYSLNKSIDTETSLEKNLI